MSKRPEVEKRHRIDPVKEQKTKRDEQVAKHMKFNIPCKNAIIKGRKVEYFPGSKAVDCLMASKWTKQRKEGDTLTPYFESREDCVIFCLRLLQNQYIIRVNKVEVKSKKPPAAGDGSGTSREKEKERDTKEGSARKRKGEKAKVDDGEADDEDEEERKKRKKRFRLEVHSKQLFLDSSEDLYYWKFDPASRSSYVFGFVIIIGAIAMSMQPLWPTSTQKGVWYLSMGLIGVLSFMISVIIARWFIFGLVMVFTVGKIHFWILPNLENDKLGVLESFKPFYSIERPSAKSKKKRKQKKEEPSRTGSSREEAGAAEVESSSKAHQSSEEEQEKREGAEDQEDEEMDTDSK